MIYYKNNVCANLASKLLLYKCGQDTTVLGICNSFYRKNVKTKKADTIFII